MIALTADLHAFASNLIQAAVRFVLLGQRDGLGSNIVLSGIMSMQHETLYSRVFRSSPWWRPLWRPFWPCSLPCMSIGGLAGGGQALTRNPAPAQSPPSLLFASPSRKQNRFHLNLKGSRS